jgi:cytochrome c biogenesis protein
MRVGLVLLGLIGVFSAIGSGPVPDVTFQTILFKILFVFLMVNMTLCTINQCRRFIMGAAGGVFSKQKARWFRPLARIVLHSGIVIILIGGAINACFGQSHQVQLVRGDSVQISEIFSGSHDFIIRLNQFEIELNDDGSPAQYYSDIELFENPEKKIQYRISVNHPLKYRGIKAYQQSFGYLINTEVGSKSMQNKILELTVGESFEIDGTDLKVKCYRYIPNFNSQAGMQSQSLKPDNPKIIYSVYQGEELIGVGAASFGEKVMIDSTKDAFVIFKTAKTFTVLSLKSDPGLYVTGAGSIMLMIGVCLVCLGKKPGE